MADYSADILFLAPLDAVGDDSGDVEVVWWGDPPPTPQPPGTGKTLDNPSFEIAEVDSGVDVDAVPASWAATGNVGVWAAATFGPPLFYVESYAALWGGNEGALDNLDNPSDVVVALFGADPITVVEGYETQWGDNEDALADLDDSGDVSAGAFNAAGDLFESYEKEWPNRHKVADYVRELTLAFPFGDPTGARALVNDIKTQFNAHIADATIHDVADATNTATSPDATDEGTTVTLTLELITDISAHLAADAYHRAYVPPFESLLTQFTPTDYDSAVEVMIEMVVTLNSHFLWRTAEGGRTFTDFIYPFVSLPVNFYALLTIADLRAPSPQYEGYEAEWAMPLDNVNAIDEFGGGDIVAAVFPTNTGTIDAETYDEIFDTVIASPGSQEVVNPTQAMRVDFAGTYGGGTTIELQVQRKGSTTWIAIDTVTTPGASRIEPGYVKFRAELTVPGSGTPTATFAFAELATI
jgi:hypothetical protein